MTHDNEKHGTGRTTKQIKAAKYSAVFICPTSYAVRDFKRTAQELKRNDLIVMSVSQTLTNNASGLRGLRFSDIVLDHSVELKAREKTRLQEAMKLRVRCE